MHDRTGEMDKHNREMEASSLVSDKNQISKKTGSQCNCQLKKCSGWIVRQMESTFLRIGCVIGKNPYKMICAAITFSFVCGIGMINFNMDGSPETLWNPSGSDIESNQKWVDERFPTKSRYVSIIAEDENVLFPGSLIKLLRLHQRVLEISNGTSTDWNSLCYRQASVCVTGSILEIWGYNETIIKHLTRDEILLELNRPKLTSHDGRRIDITRYLGKMERNSTNSIVGAKAFMAFWALKSDETYSKQTGFAKDPIAQKWENNFASLFERSNFGFKRVYYVTRSAQNDAADAAMQSDVFILSAGYMLMIMYAALMLGKFNRLMHKIWLGGISVLCVILSILICCGLSSIFGLPYGPLHNILPFLVLGIGVDDAFVIARSWRMISKKFGSTVPIHKIAAETMKSAGVSITVTSLTDFIAFAIGASTILPALRSFCVYCGLAILALYVMCCTIFLASLCLDAKRARNRRDACFCCIQLKDGYKEKECSNRSFLEAIFEFIGEKFLTRKLYIACILLITLSLFATSCFAVTRLRQEYSFEWWLPKDCAPRKYIAAKARFFPSEGLHTAVYIDNVDYMKEKGNLINLCNNIKNGKYIVKSSTQCWYPNFIEWTESLQKNNSQLNKEDIFHNASRFSSLVSKFINSRSGSFFASDVLFSNNPKLKTIVASRYRAIHIDVHSSQDEVRAMDEIKTIAKLIQFEQGRAFGFSRQYLYYLWETNKIIKEELYRNLGLASAAVFLVTLLLVANLWMSFMIFTCVVLTLVDVAGMMYFWGLTIETVTSVCLILSVGLCVDYSAHIGHSFMTSCKQTRQARAAEALSQIGPAVFNGGMSTFLAFAFLAFSNSYGFKTFFKVFLLVVVFGLFHGLVYFPVLLSLIGPSPYLVVSENDLKQSDKLSNLKIDSDQIQGSKDVREDQILVKDEEDKETVL